MYLLKVWCIKNDSKPRDRQLIKNPQFLHNQADILPTHGLVIFTKLHNDSVKIVDFSLITYFFGLTVVFMHHTLHVQYLGLNGYLGPQSIYIYNINLSFPLAKFALLGETHCIYLIGLNFPGFFRGPVVFLDLDLYNFFGL